MLGVWYHRTDTLLWKKFNYISCLLVTEVTNTGQVEAIGRWSGHEFHDTSALASEWKSHCFATFAQFCTATASTPLHSLLTVLAHRLYSPIFTTVQPTPDQPDHFHWACNTATWDDCYGNSISLSQLYAQPLLVGGQLKLAPAFISYIIYYNWISVHLNYL